MCLLIASQIGDLPTHTLLRDANFDNPDGWGTCRVENGKIAVEKGWNTPSLIAAAQRCKGFPYMIHMRFATHGTVNRRNTHPFKISAGLFMAHNGMLNIDTKSKPELSDTAHYAELIGALLTEIPDWWDAPSFIKDLEDDIGYFNKLGFLRDTGELRIVNKDMGETEGAIWYSNTNSHPVSACSTFAFGKGYRRVFAETFAKNAGIPLDDSAMKTKWWETQFSDDGQDLENDNEDEIISDENEAAYQEWLRGDNDRVPMRLATHTGISSLSEHRKPVDAPIASMDDWWDRECRMQDHATKTRLSE